MMKFEVRRTIKYFSLKFIRLKGDPHFLAMGVAVGLFIGTTPTIPFHTIAALAMAILLRGSKIAALLASMAISNPLTFFFQYYFSWKIGNWLYPANLRWEQIEALLKTITTDVGLSVSLAALGKLGMAALATLVLGGCLLALPIAAVGYLLSYRFFAAIQKKRREKHILK